MKFVKKSDIIIILIIIAISLISLITFNFVFADQPAKAEIYYYSELVETIDLNTGKDIVFSIPQDENVIFHLDKGGHINFEESDCPDKVCINTGKLNTVGQFAACLPNGIIIKIVPDKKHSFDDIDIIV